MTRSVSFPFIPIELLQYLLLPAERYKRSSRLNLARELLQDPACRHDRYALISRLKMINWHDKPGIFMRLNASHRVQRNIRSMLKPRPDNLNKLHLCVAIRGMRNSEDSSVEVLYKTLLKNIVKPEEISLMIDVFITQGAFVELRDMYNYAGSEQAQKSIEVIACQHPLLHGSAGMISGVVSALPLSSEPVYQLLQREYRSHFLCSADEYCYSYYRVLKHRAETLVEVPDYDLIYNLLRHANTFKHEQSAVEWIICVMRNNDVNAILTQAMKVLDDTTYSYNAKRTVFQCVLRLAHADPTHASVNATVAYCYENGLGCQRSLPLAKSHRDIEKDMSSVLHIPKQVSEIKFYMMLLGASDKRFMFEHVQAASHAFRLDDSCKQIAQLTRQYARKSGDDHWSTIAECMHLTYEISYKDDLVSAASDPAVRDRLSVFERWDALDTCQPIHVYVRYSTPVASGGHYFLLTFFKYKGELYMIQTDRLKEHGSIPGLMVYRVGNSAPISTIEGIRDLIVKCDSQYFARKKQGDGSVITLFELLQAEHLVAFDIAKSAQKGGSCALNTIQDLALVEMTLAVLLGGVDESEIAAAAEETKSASDLPDFTPALLRHCFDSANLRFKPYRQWLRERSLERLVENHEAGIVGAEQHSVIMHHAVDYVMRKWALRDESVDTGAFRRYMGLFNRVLSYEEVRVTACDYTEKQKETLREKLRPMMALTGQ